MVYRECRKIPTYGTSYRSAFNWTIDRLSSLTRALNKRSIRRGSHRIVRNVAWMRFALWAHRFISSNQLPSNWPVHSVGWGCIAESYRSYKWMKLFLLTTFRNQRSQTIISKQCSSSGTEISGQYLSALKMMSSMCIKLTHSMVSVLLFAPLENGNIVSCSLGWKRPLKSFFSSNLVLYHRWFEVIE